MDLHEHFALVSILLRVSPCYERWLQRLHACGVSKKNLTSSGLDFFLTVIRFNALGAVSLDRLFRNLPFCSLRGI